MIYKGHALLMSGSENTGGYEKVIPIMQTEFWRKNQHTVSSWRKRANICPEICPFCVPCESCHGQETRLHNSKSGSHRQRETSIFHEDRGSKNCVSTVKYNWLPRTEVLTRMFQIHVNTRNSVHLCHNMFVYISDSENNGLCWFHSDHRLNSNFLLIRPAPNCKAGLTYDSQIHADEVVLAYWRQYSKIFPWRDKKNHEIFARTVSVQYSWNLGINKRMILKWVLIWVSGSEVGVVVQEMVQWRACEHCRVS